MGLRQHARPCNTPGCCHPRAPRCSYCLACRQARAAKETAHRNRNGESRRLTRTCLRCRDRLDLEEFREEATFQGRAYYHAECDNCRGEKGGSPYAVARRMVERLFGVPSREWLNKARHPLNRLHYAWMVAINNVRAAHDVDAEGKPLGHYFVVPRKSDLSSLAVSFRHALAQGYPLVARPRTAARSVA